MKNEHIREQIKAEMDKRDWSQSKLAELSGVSRQRISQIINTKGYNWSHKTIVRVLEALELTDLIKLLK